MADFVQLKVPTELADRLREHSDLMDISVTQGALRIITETLDAVEAPNDQTPPIIPYLRRLRENRLMLNASKAPSTKKPR